MPREYCQLEALILSLRQIYRLLPLEKQNQIVALTSRAGGVRSSPQAGSCQGQLALPELRHIGKSTGSLYPVAKQTWGWQPWEPDHAMRNLPWCPPPQSSELHLTRQVSSGSIHDHREISDFWGADECRWSSKWRSLRDSCRSYRGGSKLDFRVATPAAPRM